MIGKTIDKILKKLSRNMLFVLSLPNCRVFTVRQVKGDFNYLFISCPKKPRTQKFVLLKSTPESSNWP